MARLSNEALRESLAELEHVLRSGIASGEYGAGQLLPGARALAERHRVGRRMVQVAMRALERDGLVSAEARRGYRVRAQDGNDGPGAALAFVVPRSSSGEFHTHHSVLLDHLQGAAGARGRPVLAVGGRDASRDEIVAHLRSHRVGGVVVNSNEPGLVSALTRLHSPMIAVDVWHPDMQMDAVIQDGFLGGYLAAQYLADRGHQRVAYFGRAVPRETGLLPANRVGGAVAGLLDNGLDLPARMRAIGRKDDRASLSGAAERLLSGTPRPTAVIALWASFAAAIAEEADRLGLKLGDDLEIVGWGVREEIAAAGTGRFPQDYRPPRVTWSIRDMAETAVARIEMRLGSPALPPTVLKIPVRLDVPGSNEPEGAELSEGRDDR